MSDKPCIGVLGGLGPYAGLDLVRKIFDQTKADHDQDHLRVMLYSFPSDIPVRPEFLLGLTKENPGEAIGDIMVRMADAGATIIGMPCNTAHSPRILNVALERLASAGKQVQFVHIIEATVSEVCKTCPLGTRVGLMATVATLRTGLYQEALQQTGYVPVILGEEDCAKVQDAISNKTYGIKASSNPVSAYTRDILLQAAYTLLEMDISVLLLGCTEIPLALTEREIRGIPVIDATRVLARDLVLAYDPQKFLVH